MIVLNFTHPLTAKQLTEIEEATGQPISRLIDLPAHFDQSAPFAEQARQLADAAGLSPAEWQTEPILINPPSLNFIAMTLLAELHGRMGYFPPIIRLRPAPDALPPRYELAEIISLQQVRDRARNRR